MSMTPASYLLRLGVYRNRNPELSLISEKMELSVFYAFDTSLWADAVIRQLLDLERFKTSTTIKVYQNTDREKETAREQ